jgi:hypothetical protein
MQITFDPHIANECDETLCIIAQAQPDVVRMWLIDYNEDQDSETAQPDTAQSVKAAVAEVMRADTAPAQPETAQPETAPTWTPDLAQPETAQPETATAQPETDCHGMVHDGTIHSTPASKNADGSWRAKRGHKEAYEAAIAAATCNDAPTPAPAPQGMPMPNPASAAPATPPAPIDYKTMAERFMAKMADPDGLPDEYEAIYAALSIGYDDLETNQTSIARLSAYMDAVDNGDDHDGCVRHAMSADQ